MSKYVIRNCELIHSADNFCWSKNIFCQDCTDCLLKQIVEKCKEHTLCDCACSDDILKLLDIQEIE